MEIERLKLENHTIRTSFAHQNERLRQLELENKSLKAQLIPIVTPNVPETRAPTEEPNAAVGDYVKALRSPSKRDFNHGWVGKITGVETKLVYSIQWKLKRKMSFVCSWQKMTNERSENITANNFRVVKGDERETLIETLTEKYPNGRRRLIDRFIRESERCINS